MVAKTRRFSIALLAGLALPSKTLAEEPPSDLRSVQVEPISSELAGEEMVRAMVARAAHPSLPEAQAQQLFDQLVAMGTSSSPTLRAIYQDSKSSDLEGWVAARALGHLGGDVALETLLGGLGSKQIMDRLGAISALSLMKDPRSVSPLEGALYDKAMMVRASAADALAAIGAIRSAKALSESLNLPANFKGGRSLFVRKHIVDALGDLGSLQAVPTLLQTLGDKDEGIRLASVFALTRITGKTFREPNTLNAPVSTAEAASWKQWWGDRSAQTWSE